MQLGSIRPESLASRLLWFWVGFVLLTLGLWLVVTQQWVLRPMCEWTASLLAAALQLVGQDIHVSGNLVSSNRGGVPFEIIGECTALLPLSFVVAFMLTFPVSWRSKWVGVACAIPVILACNLARLGSLWFLAQAGASQFEVVHMVVWPSLMVLFPAMLLLFWAQLAMRNERHDSRLS